MSLDFIKQHSRWFVSGILVLFGIVSLVVSAQESTTMDEKAHIPASYSYVKYLDMRINPEHPPLLKDLSGLSMLLISPNPNFPKDDPLWENGDNINQANHPEGKVRTWGLAQWAFGDMFLHGSGNSAWMVTFFARLPFILIGIFLGLAIYLWTRELGGTIAGLLALTLYAFDPNILGHSHYVTTDIGIAAFIFFAFYFFVRFLKSPNTKNIWLAGLFLGLAQLTKFSAVLLFPIFGLFVIVYALTRRKPASSNLTTRQFLFRSLFEYIWKFSASVAICFGLIYVVYAVNTWNMPETVIQEIARYQFPNSRAIGQVAENTVVFLASNPILKPFGEYFLGVFMVFARVAGGNTYYFLGQVDNHASAWYFPVVFLLKETLPFLFLLVLTTGYTLFRIFKRAVGKQASEAWYFFADSFQHHIAQYLAAFFVLFYSYVSITGNLNIGLRHLFPILPFLYMLVAKTVLDIYRRHADTAGHLLRPGLLVLVLSTIAIPILSFPYYLSYFNASIGGHKNGYLYVTDSNYDWGQDVLRLRDFVSEFNACKNGTGMNPRICALGRLPAIDTIRVDYFGGSNPQYYLGDTYKQWSSGYTPEAGWYAISAGFYMESMYKVKQPGERGYEWLRDNGTMIGRAGDSIFLFYVPEDKVPRE